MEERLARKQRVQQVVAIIRVGTSLLNIILWASLGNWFMIGLSIGLAWLVCVTLRDWLLISEHRYLRRMLDIYEQEEDEYEVDDPIVVYWVARVVFFVSVLVLFGLLAAGVYWRYFG